MKVQPPNNGVLIQMASLSLKVLNGWTSEVGGLWKLVPRLFRCEIQVQGNSHPSHLNTESHKVLKYSTQFTGNYFECFCVATRNSWKNCSKNFLCQNCEHKARAIRTCKRFEEIQMFVKTGFRNRDEHWTLWRKLSQIPNLEVGRQFVYLPSLQSLRWKITIFGKLRRLWGSLLRQSVSSNLAETTNVSKWFWSILNLQLVVL